MSPVWVRLGLVVDLGQAEIGDPDSPARVEQQVRRLDVAVDDSLGVGVGQCVGDLDADPGHALPVRPPFRLAPMRSPTSSVSDDDVTLEPSRAVQLPARVVPSYRHRPVEDRTGARTGRSKASGPRRPPTRPGLLG